jgi:hypothetical protein
MHTRLAEVEQDVILVRGIFRRSLSPAPAGTQHSSGAFFYQESPRCERSERHHAT